MKRSLPALLIAAAAILPASHAGAASKKTTPTVPTAKAKPPVTRTFAGPSADMEWGPVQVTLIVKNKKVIDIRASAPTERERSAFINQQALPLLKQEVLHAQSANIYAISGATMTSDAYYQSLQVALAAAHKAHAL